VATVWRERRLCLGWWSSAFGWREERKSDERGRGGGFKRKEKRKGAPPLLWKELLLGLGLFLYFFSSVSKLPPLLLYVLKAIIYRQNVAWALKLVPQLPFFVNFDFFLIFLDFSYQHRLEWGKSVIFKNNALKSNAFPWSLKI